MTFFFWWTHQLILLSFNYLKVKLRVEFMRDLQVICHVHVKQDQNLSLNVYVEDDVFVGERYRGEVGTIAVQYVDFNFLKIKD